jgi:hypothetical protein
MLSIFNCHEARLHTLPNAPTLREANHEQLQEHSKRLEVLNAGKIVPRFGTDPEADEEPYGFFTSACHEMLEQEDYWRQCRLIWSWIDERPVWLSPVDWHVDILPDPGRELTRRFRFTLLGGGQITVSEQFKRSSISTSDSSPHFYCLHPDLRVIADAGEGLRRFSGTITGFHFEMNAEAVLFLPGTPQSIADRVAATFRLLTYKHLVGTDVRGPDPDNFSALLDRSERCCVCNRALRDHVSTLLGIGPDCAEQMHLQHGLAAANKLIQRRRELLGEQAAQHHGGVFGHGATS